MAGLVKNAMSFLGMTDVVDAEDEIMDEEETGDGFDTDHTVTPMAAQSSAAGQEGESTPFQSHINRITTIHPKSYEDAQMVGRALRDGVPVVLNLTGVSESVAYRIVDFSAGVVFGVRGSIERVTPRVFLLSPAQVNIKVEEVKSSSSAKGLFAQ